MGNELGCASGEKSTKAQQAEERYQASAPLEAGTPAAAATSPATADEKSASDAPLPNDRVAEPALKAEAAAPGLHAAVNLDDATAATERPPEGTDEPTPEQQGERPPLAAVEEEAVAPAVAPPVCEEPVIATASAPAQMAEAPLQQPETVQPESSPAQDAEAVHSADKTPGDVDTSTVAAVVAADVSAVDSSTAPACKPASSNAIVEPAEPPLSDAIANDARQHEQQQLQPTVPAVVVSVDNDSASDTTEEAGLQQPPPPPEITICPPCITESEEEEQQQLPAAVDSVPSAEPDRPIVTVEATSTNEFPLPPSGESIIAGPCAVYPGDIPAEAAAEVPEPEPTVANDTEAAHPAEGDSELMPPPPAEPHSDYAACQALESVSIVPPIVINVAGELPAEAENEESIAAAVLAAGNRSLELSAPGAENGSQPQVSSPSKDDSAAAGDGLDSQEKMNGDSDVASHECTTPTSPTGAEGGAGSQKKVKTGTSSHSRIPVLQGGLHAPTKSK